MKSIKETIQTNIDSSTEIYKPYYDESTIRGYLSRHYIDTPPPSRAAHPLLPEPYVQTREQMRKEMNNVQQKLVDGEIDGMEALVKLLSLFDNYFNTLDAEEVKYLSGLKLENFHADLYRNE